MEDTRKMVCDRCRSVVPIAQIKFLPQGRDGRTALCAACREETMTIKGTNAKKQGMKKEDFFCARCKYKFQFNAAGSTNLKCPYCGKSDKVIDSRPQSAENIIQTSDKENRI